MSSLKKNGTINLYFGVEIISFIDYLINYRTSKNYFLGVATIETK